MTQKRVAGWGLTIYSVGVTGCAHFYTYFIGESDLVGKLEGIFIFQALHISIYGWDFAEADIAGNTNKHALNFTPTIIEYLAAGLCPSQVLLGPSDHFKGFYNFIYRREEYSETIDSFSHSLKLFI